MMDDLFAEAERQLNICNSCRYCEGYCAVFPALERRTLLGAGDLAHLANLCHDCRACFYACMYAPPHEFGVNPPQILSAARLASYRDHLPRWAPPAWWAGAARLRGRGARLVAVVLVTAALLVIAALSEGLGALVRHGGPYQLIPYPVLLVTVLLPCAWSAAIMLRALARHWRDTGGSRAGPRRGPARWAVLGRAVARAAGQAARLRYLRGGGGECYYPGGDPSAARRRLHAAVAGGFGLCLASTASAAVMQDVLGLPPPYPLLSAPVLLGTAGGIGLVAGCAGLIALRRHADPVPGVADYGLLTGLGLLGATGLLTLVLRATPLYGPALTAHLATIVICFAVAPYTRFAHVGYRFLALIQDNLEQGRPGPDAARPGSGTGH
jgi:citrate/tricarballylate utilization protein